ncbi:MAG: hypothetical protein ACOCQD_02600 [archaeon]
MSSRILHDTRDNSILRCQPEPNGSAGLPSFKGLCRSARIPEDEKQYMETCIISDNMLTKEAVRNLRINNGEAVLKPKVELSVDKTEVDVSENETFALSVDISDTLEGEAFSEIDISVEDAVITIELENNQGSANIELVDEGVYTIKCEDNNFRTQIIKVEGV